MRLGFRTKLLASHVALVAAVITIVILELYRSLAADLARQLDQRLEQQAQGAAQWVGEGRRHPEKLAGRLANVVHADVTIFDRDGTVVGDSTHVAPEVAPTPPEVAAAHRGEIGRATRAGAGGEVHYVAVLAADGIVVRLAAPLSDISATLAGMRARLLRASAVALAVAIALAFFASRVAVRPLRAMTRSATRIAAGDYDIAPGPATPDEFGVLSNALASLASQLAARIGDLTAERDRLSAILAGMDEGVVVLGGGRVLVANPAASAIAGGELVGKTLAEALPRGELRTFIEASADARDETRAAEIEDGGRSIALYVRPLAATHDRRAGVVVVMRDMTALRRLMTMRRDFVANVSHELRTPVAAIQGYAETLLGGGGDDATRRQFLEIVHRQAQRIGALVEDLLRLSELEARAPEAAVREAVDVAAIAEHVAHAVRERASKRGAHIALDVREGAIADGDPSGVEQVLLNLVDNAIKYGRDGGRVVVEGRRDAERVTVSIADDGPGIDARHLPRVFERFYRVDDGRARERGGTGLGLAIVKHIVEAMGGSVRVESEPGKGTRFVVELPARA